MLEENKNLENQKRKPGKSWLFWVGSVLLILAVGLTWYVNSHCVQDGPGCVIALYFTVFLFFPLGSLGTILILIYVFKKLREKRKLSLFELIIFAICLFPLLIFLILVLFIIRFLISVYLPIFF